MTSISGGLFSRRAQILDISKVRPTRIINILYQMCHVAIDTSHTYIYQHLPSHHVPFRSFTGISWPAAAFCHVMMVIKQIFLKFDTFHGTAQALRIEPRL